MKTGESNQKHTHIWITGPNQQLNEYRKIVIFKLIAALSFMQIENIGSTWCKNGKVFVFLFRVRIWFVAHWKKRKTFVTLQKAIQKEAKNQMTRMLFFWSSVVWKLARNYENCVVLEFRIVNVWKKCFVSIWIHLFFCSFIGNTYVQNVVKLHKHF